MHQSQGLVLKSKIQRLYWNLNPHNLFILFRDTFRKKSALTDTLIPLVVLDVALGAATSVATQDVLAAVLAPVVPITFINICKNKPGKTFMSLSSTIFKCTPNETWGNCYHGNKHTRRDTQRVCHFSRSLLVSGGARKSSEIRDHLILLLSTRPRHVSALSNISISASQPQPPQMLCFLN